MLAELSAEKMAIKEEFTHAALTRAEWSPLIPSLTTRPQMLSMSFESLRFENPEPFWVVRYLH